eukprot:g30682.t1
MTCLVSIQGFLQDLAGVLDGFHSCLQEASLGILHLSARCINGLMRARRQLNLLELLPGRSSMMMKKVRLLILGCRAAPWHAVPFDGIAT